MIRTRFAASFLAVTLVVASMPQASDADQPRKIPRIALIFPDADCTDKTLKHMQAFENGLREHGYIAGQNIAIPADQPPA